MNDLELSLDDIIKKKLKKKGIFRNKNNAGTLKKPVNKISESNNRVLKKPNVKAVINSNLRPNAVRGKGSLPGLRDARLRIIQKQRRKMTDAREKLGQIAKQTDARLKLVKLRERQRGNTTAGRVSTFRMDHSILQRTVQSRINNYFDDELMDYTDDMSYLDRNFADALASSDDFYSYFHRNRSDESVLYRTVENEIPVNRLTEKEKSIYAWKKPASVLDELDIPALRTGSKTSPSFSWSEFKGNTPTWNSDDTPIIITKKVKPQETVGILKRSTLGSVYIGPTVKIIKDSPPPSKSKGPIRTLSERFCQEGNVSAQKISLLKAKLEASQKNKNTLDTQTALGHRIVVSNLVPSVTHEDVKELFEDIGELISSKVVCPGMAEVIYKFHKDAVKAVDVYHNRQLDGQPMKCLLVNKSVLPASKLLKDAGGKVGKQVVEVDMTAFRKALHKKSAS